MGHSNGTASAWDEYGGCRGSMGSRISDKPQEWETFQLAKYEWARKRTGKSRARTDERMGRDVSDKMMDDFLREEGLLPAC